MSTINDQYDYALAQVPLILIGIILVELCLLIITILPQNGYHALLLYDQYDHSLVKKNPSPADLKIAFMIKPSLFYIPLYSVCLHFVIEYRRLL